MAEISTSDAVPDEIDGQEASHTTMSDVTDAQLHSKLRGLYDSDGQVGPFLDAVIGEEMFEYFETAVPTIGFVFLNSFPPCRGL